MAKQNSLQTSLEKKLEKAAEDWQKTVVRCGIIGRSGVGKSSLINRIAGKSIAEVGVVETTQEAQEYHHGSTVFVDLPGCDTQKWPLSTYAERLGLETFDCFCLVTASRFHDTDLQLLEQVRNSLNKPCFLVRNKIDIDVISMRKHKNWSTTETLHHIRADLLANSAHVGTTCFLLSAEEPLNYDFMLLLDAIQDSLPDQKRLKFIADSAAYEKEQIEKKSEAATKIVGIYAGLSALNGLNPIPGTDFVADVALLLKMVNELRHTYGLDEQQASFIDAISTGDSKRAALLVSARFAAKYGSEVAVKLILEKLAARLVLKNAAKWVPFVGNVVAAGASFVLTYSFGESVANDCEKAAFEMIETIHAKVTI